MKGTRSRRQAPADPAISAAINAALRAALADLGLGSVKGESRSQAPVSDSALRATFAALSRTARAVEGKGAKKGKWYADGLTDEPVAIGSTGRSLIMRII